MNAAGGPAVSRNEERDALTVPAPNAVEWIVGREWLNVPTLYEFTRQYQIVRDFFQLRCPLCNPGGSVLNQARTDRGHPGDCWGRSQMELEDEVLLRWSKGHDDDVCPKCNTTRTELTEEGLLGSYNTLHCVVGMRAGKSVMAGLIGTYVEHRMLTLSLSEPRGIQGYLGMPEAEQLELTFLASTDVQSQDTIWAKFKNYRAVAPWFQRYVPWVKTQQAAQVTPVGMQKWAYEESDKKIRNGHCKLLINSLNSNSGAIVGKTRILAAADEIGRMKQTDSSMGAAEIYRGLESSLHTVRTSTTNRSLLPWMGMMLSVTSPMADEDKAMDLLRIGQSGEVKGMLAYHYATWDFNPREPRENFDEDYAKDPIAAERNFGARPPKAAFPLIPDPERFEHNAIGEGTPTATFRHVPAKDEKGQQYIGIELVNALLLHGMTQGGRQRVAPRYIAFDAGKNFDAFAGACAHGEFVTDADGTQKLVTVFDWVCRILTPAREIQVLFESVFDMIKALKTRQPIARVEFDRWQSLQMVQNMRFQLGVFAEQNPVTDNDFHTFAADAMIGRVRLLPPLPGDAEAKPPEKSPMGTIIYELEHLERDPKTDKVDNPHKGERRGWNSDDCARVAVHVHRLVQATGYTKKADDRSRRARRERAEVGGDGWGNRGTLAAQRASGPPQYPTSGRKW